MIRTQIQVTETQAHQLEELANQQRISKSELIRRALDAYFRQPTKLTPDERRRTARRVVGRFRSGKSDVSTRHEDYLAEAFGE